jgi:hypothetical protein
MKLTQFKAWCMDEARRTGLRPVSIASRVVRGKYPWLSLIRINKRVVYVESP